MTLITRCQARLRAATACTLIFAALCGCTTQTPLVSHAHVGHALTSWHDTPEQKGLMVVAADDLALAVRQADTACSVSDSYQGAQHLNNVINALVPEAQPAGPGSGYGAIRALMGTIEHLEYAATSPDSSLNLVSAVAQLTVHGESIHARLKVAVELAQHLLSSPPGDWPVYCAQMRDELRVAMHGGVIGPDHGGITSIGFDALHKQLTAALEREHDPVYTPVPRRYVLGLVRMPSGLWQYRLSQPKRDTFTYSGNYGY